jgi:hypothetical protein
VPRASRTIIEHTETVTAARPRERIDGRRNRYQIQVHLPLPEPTSRERTVSEVLALLTGDEVPR